MCFTDPTGWRFKGPGFMGIGIPGNPNFRVELPNIAGPQGQGFANAWINASSRRWKENIRALESPLSIIARLRGVRFDWKPEQGGKPDIGFIAEEVAEVCPELVAMADNGSDAKGLNYSHMIAITVEGMKEQQRQIRTLQSQNDELRNEMADLRNRLLALSVAIQEVEKKRR